MRPAILAVGSADYTLLFAVAVAVLGAAVLIQLKNVRSSQKVPTLSFWYTI